MTTLGELCTTLSLEDAYFIFEVSAIDTYNSRPPDRGSKP
jgi:hypothetical protein